MWGLLGYFVFACCLLFHAYSWAFALGGMCLLRILA